MNKENLKIILIILVAVLLGMVVFNPLDFGNTSPIQTPTATSTIVSVIPSPTVAVLTSTPTSTVSPTVTSPPLTSTPTPVNTATLVPTVTPVPEPTKEVMYGHYFYEIERGDTLWYIAIKSYGEGQGMKYVWICEINKLTHNCDLIHAGNVIWIPEYFGE